MNCSEARDKLLMLTPAEIGGAAPELRAHLASCAACREYLAQLSRLEAAVAAFGVPVESTVAKQAFQDRLRFRLQPAASAAAATQAKGSTAGKTRTGLWRRLAVAALLLLATGLASVMLIGGNDSAQAAPDVVDQLVDWNAELAQTPDLPARAELYHRHAMYFRRLLQGAAMSPGQAQLAAALLDHGSWLAQHADPLDEADRFNRLAKMIADQSGQEAGQHNFARSALLAHNYQLLRRVGVSANLDRLAAGRPGPLVRARIEWLRHHDGEVAARVNRLLQQREVGEQWREYRKTHPASSDSTTGPSEEAR
jgi:hypothetical protein